METDVIRVLKEKGINVPEHHENSIDHLWKSFLQLRQKSKIDEFSHHNLGVINAIGGEKYE